MIAPHPETAESRFQALRRKPRAVRRLAVLADIDLALAVLDALAAAGYGVSGLPADAAALRAALIASESDAIMLNDYAAFYATLPAALRDAVATRWGAAERDPLFRPGQVDCGRFTITVAYFGVAAVIAAPTDDPAAPPRHHMLAHIAWASDIWRADALIAQRSFDYAFTLPMFVPAASDRPDVAAVAAALDGDVAALRRWHMT